MKIGIFLILVTCSFVPLAAANSCLTLNPFLKDLSQTKPVSVQIWDSPKKDNIAHCFTEWGPHGTCCDQYDLAAMAKLEEVLMNSNELALIKAFDEMKRAIQRSSDIFLTSPVNHQKFVASSQELKAYHDIYSFNNFKGESNKCWKTMREARSSALCSICSGRSKQFFEKDKILVPQDTCKKVVEDCELFFVKLSTIIKEYPKVLDGYKRLKLLKEEEYEEYDIMQRELKTYAPTQELLDGFAEYEARKKEKGSEIQAAKVCSMILNIRKTPYIMEMNPENIEAVAHTTQQQLERKFSSTMAALSQNDAVARQQIQSTYDMDVQSENQYHRDKLAQIEQLKYITVPRNLQRYGGGKGGMRYKSPPPMTIQALNPEYETKYQAEMQRHNFRLQDLQNNFQATIYDISQAKVKRETDISNNHKQRIQQVQDEKLLNLQRWNQIRSSRNNRPNSRPRRLEFTGSNWSGRGNTIQQSLAEPTPNEQLKELSSKTRIFDSDSLVLVNNIGDEKSVIGLPGICLEGNLNNQRAANLSLIFP